LTSITSEVLREACRTAFGDTVPQARDKTQLTRRNEASRSEACPNPVPAQRALNFLQQLQNTALIDFWIVEFLDVTPIDYRELRSSRREVLAIAAGRFDQVKQSPHILNFPPPIMHYNAR